MNSRYNMYYIVLYVHKCDYIYNQRTTLNVNNNKAEKESEKNWIGKNELIRNTFAYGVKAYMYTPNNVLQHLLKFRLHLVNQTSPFLCVLPCMCVV